RSRPSSCSWASCNLQLLANHFLLILATEPNEPSQLPALICALCSLQERRWFFLTNRAVQHQLPKIRVVLQCRESQLGVEEHAHIMRLHVQRNPRCLRDDFRPSCPRYAAGASVAFICFRP